MPSTKWGSLGRYITVFMLAILAGFSLVIITQATPSSLPDDPPITLYSASTEANICTGDAGCGTVRLDVDSTRNGEGDVLCMEITTESRHERGCANVTDSVRVDTLAGTSAELPSTSLDLHTLACDGQEPCRAASTRTVNVRASWAAPGTGDHPDRAGNACTWPRSTDGEAHPASTSLSINDYTIETFGDIRLVEASPLSDCGDQES